VYSENKFYGMYRAVVADANDPEDLGRVSLIVPQVLGQSVTNWAWPVGGAISQVKYPYGSFSTSGNQTLGVNTATKITGFAEDDTNRMYLSNNRMYVQETGDYFLQFSAVLTKSNSSSGTADIWIRKNGTNIPKTGTRIHLSGQGAEVVMTAGLILDLKVGEYIEFYGSANSTNTLITSYAANTGPAIPGVIASLNLVGKWKPQPNTTVWAMFEGGDPNFPLWIGAS
jgi:hypothetical protein